MTLATATFFMTHLQRQEKQKKMNIWDFIRIRSFCTAKETVKKTKSPQNGRIYLQMTYVIKGQYPKIYKELIKLNSYKKRKEKEEEGEGEESS